MSFFPVAVFLLVLSWTPWVRGLGLCGKLYGRTFRDFPAR